MSSSCSVCCEDYNKSTRSKIKCSSGECAFDACKSCVRRYLLTINNDPHCMNCKTAWGQDFIVMNLNRSFVNTEYKQKRQSLLLEQELSKMPATMGAAERQKQINSERDIINKISEQIMSLRIEMDALNMQKRSHAREINKIRNNTGTSQEKNKFIMPCPGNDCRGFLSSQYKCGVCERFTCPKCLVMIDKNAGAEHICDENMVKSAALIKQETKPCPSCGSRISKISGCNQMWCTNCHVAFSWTSGTIDNGPVHNPHFYEYQKQTNNGVAPRNPGDILCGGLINFYTLRAILLNSSVKKKLKEDIHLDQNMFTSLHRLSGHVSAISLPYYREIVREVDHNEPLRVNYILGNVTKDELRQEVYKQDYNRQKCAEILHVMELMNVSAIEMFSQIASNDIKMDDFYDKMKDAYGEITQLITYCNDVLKKISISYNRAVPRFVVTIKKEWNIIDYKYNGYSEQKKIIQNIKT